MDFEVNKTMENGRKCYGAETKKHSLGTSLYDFTCLRKTPGAPPRAVRKGAFPISEMM